MLSYDNGTLENLKVNEQVKTLDLLIRAYTDDDEFLFPEILEETNLFVFFFVIILFKLINIIIIHLHYYTQ